LGDAFTALLFQSMVGAAFSRDKRRKKKSFASAADQEDENGIYTTWMLGSKAPVVLCFL